MFEGTNMRAAIKALYKCKDRLINNCIVCFQRAIYNCKATRKHIAFWPHQSGFEYWSWHWDFFSTPPGFFHILYRQICPYIFCLFNIRTLLSKSATKTKLLNNEFEMFFQTKMIYVKYSFRDVILKLGNFTKNIWPIIVFAIWLFWVVFF